MKWARTKEIIKIVEVTAPRPQIADANLDESIRSLSSHPGFQALNNRLRLQGAALDTTLKTRLDLTQDQNQALKLGIYWCNWLDTQIKRLVYKAPAETHIDPLQGELQAFEELNESLERVGM